LFEISYPLFLNIENHCSYEQQGIMARHLKEIFKGKLDFFIIINYFIVYYRSFIIETIER
jgi:hypothetical protein